MSLLSETSRRTTFDQLSTLRGSRAFPNLVRSVFDADVKSTVCALIQQDDLPPVLAANAFRHAMMTADDPVEQWDICADMTTRTVAEVHANPDQYAHTVVNQTRNSIRSDDTRKNASGMVSYRTEETYSDAPIAHAYGLLWAYERQAYQGYDLAKKSVSTYLVKNTFGIDLPGEIVGEVVHPAVIPNSSLNGVLFSYDLQVDSSRIESMRSLLLDTDTSSVPPVVYIKEHPTIGRDLHNSHDGEDMCVIDYKAVGTLTIEDSKLTVNGPSYYQTLFTKLP